MPDLGVTGGWEGHSVTKESRGLSCHHPTPWLVAWREQRMLLSLQGLLGGKGWLCPSRSLGQSMAMCAQGRSRSQIGGWREQGEDWRLLLDIEEIS